MRIIHGAGYTLEDRKSYIELVHQNVFMGIQALVNAIETLGIGFEHDDNRQKAKDMIVPVDYRKVNNSALAQVYSVALRDENEVDSG